MKEIPGNDIEEIAFAEETAEQLFRAKDGDTLPTYEPSDSRTANAAVRRLGELFDKLPGAIATALDAARISGELLSSDRLQGLAEIVQNADDVEASEVRILLKPRELLVGHNGTPVRLSHILGLATPWLSTKGPDATAIGRFGIGLSTLRSLSQTLEVHCSPYHVRFGDPVLSPIDQPTLPVGFDEAGWTTLRIPLDQGTVTPSELVEWLDRWDDAALLFLRNVSKITLREPGGDAIRQLSISRRDQGGTRLDNLSLNRTISRYRVETGGGRSWIVYSEDVPTPEGVLRTKKATEQTTPIAIALPLYQVDSGQIYAGLPVTRSGLPVFVNAQFDPLTSRRDLADTNWNRALVPLVAELWSTAALDLFSYDPTTAWQAMPIDKETDQDTASLLVNFLENEIFTSARQSVASQLRFPVSGKGRMSISQLAVEAKPLERILTLAETAGLAKLPATLPLRVRDPAGKWRSVLDDWRMAGADLPEPVSVERAIGLVSDEMRPVRSAIALVAAALKDNLGERLLELPCIIACDGRHLKPPSGDNPEAVATELSPLAKQLGLVTELHVEHLGRGTAARNVLQWLRECGALLDGTDDRVVVRRIAATGKSGRQIINPLTNEQVQALREAFESLDSSERQELGSNVGRAIALDAYKYEMDGRKRQRLKINARPADAYLSRSIDRETDSYAAAAGKSVGIVWLSGRYANLLRSSAGREGIGALHFLRLLGAERAPRPVPHPSLKERYYADTRLGLSNAVHGGPPARSQAMRDRNATYTLQDRDCPALTAVVESIARVRNSKQRRKRAGALLATLGRAWDRLYSDFAEVEAAHDHHRWILRGRIPAYWLWRVRDIEWLDDESGTPRHPSELYLRSSGTEAIYGKNSPNYLHSDLYHPNRQAVLSALGVLGDPSRSKLVDRIKELRNRTEKGEISGDELVQETGVVYKALARSLTMPRSRSDLSETQLREIFQDSQGLIFSNLGWRPLQSVFAGPQIFGSYGAFPPAIADTERLWSTLKLNRPSLTDCLEVIRKIARQRTPPDANKEAILIETLRLLASQYATNTKSEDRRKFARLPLWTSKGWMRDRPVYATNDPLLAEGLRNYIPIWKPGGVLEQFRALLDLLRVQEIRPEDARVMNLIGAEEDQGWTNRFRLALQQLQDDLARNDPQLAQSLRISWDSLIGFSIYVCPTLMLRIPILRNGANETYECNVAVKVDTSQGAVFVRSPLHDLPHVDRGGLALAALFEGDSRRLAHAWRVAWERAEGEQEAEPLELAQQRDERQRAENESGIAKRTAAFRERTAATQRETVRTGGHRQTGSTSSGLRANGNGDGEAATDFGAPRVLVDPQSLELVNWHGRITKEASNPGRRTGRGGGLAEPKQESHSPHKRSSIRLYSDLDRENVGFDLVRRLLSSDREELVDLRTQRGVGADAIDKMQRFYELKVSAGAEPDQVTLTNAEVKRALSTPDFFLVVVSGVEGVDARPTVRVFVDPLKQLQPTDSGAITLSGVRNAESLVYEFAPTDDPDPLSGEE